VRIDLAERLEIQVRVRCEADSRSLCFLDLPVRLS
jgi:hypothetical protein